MGRQNPYGSRVVLVRVDEHVRVKSLFLVVHSSYLLTLCRYCISHRMDDHWHYHLFSPHKRPPRHWHLLTGHASTPHYHPGHHLFSVCPPRLTNSFQHVNCKLFLIPDRLDLQSLSRQPVPQQRGDDNCDGRAIMVTMTATVTTGLKASHQNLCSAVYTFLTMVLPPQLLRLQLPWAVRQVPVTRQSCDPLPYPYVAVPANPPRSLRRR
ncbi:hypothetical protein EDB85DRAFT_429098 [Lactarius pseudohatsudake]|nr:hypothetical protein EDB85DRAFT_429098 [Lactarius pseudohatsudake]